MIFTNKEIPFQEILMVIHVTEKVGIAYVSKSCDFPKKDIFDGLHKQLKSSFGMYLPKKKFPFQEIFDGLPKKEILMTYISNSKMLLAKITKKGNSPKKKLYARNFGKCQKNPKKY